MVNNQTRGKLKVIATGSGSVFANRVVKHIKSYQEKDDTTNGSILVKSKEIEFGDTEIKTEIEESLRGADVYILADCVNSVYPHPDEPFTIDQNLRALKTTVSAATEANHITVILPYFPYSRQDKRIAREGIIAKDVARELELSGADQVITFDIHNPAIAGFFNKAKLENLLASKNMLEQIKLDFDLAKTVICSPDAGGVKRAEYYCDRLGTDFAILHKKRDYKKGGEISKMILIGEVKGQDVLVVDDMAATCGTMENAIVTLKDSGAKSVSYAVTHAILNRKPRDPKTGLAPKQNGKDKIIEYHQKGLLKRFYCANIINHGDFYKKHDFIMAVSMDKYLASVIHHLNIGKSISALLSKDYDLL